MVRAWSRATCTSRSFVINSVGPRRRLVTLAIETSCDDTAVAILEKRGSKAILHFNEKITSNNAAFQGIHPLVSLEHHKTHLAALVRKAITHLPAKALSSALDSIPKPDFVAVTRGPGMMPCLSTGMDTAKGLAVAWDVPLLGVHHMQAHALTPRLQNALDLAANEGMQNTADGAESASKPDFPFLSVLVSGGHSLLIRSSGLTDHTILASTVDIAMGDCIDKIARAIVPASVLYAAEKPMPGPILEKFAFPDGPHSDYEYTPPSSFAQEMSSSRRPSAYGWPIAAPFVIGEGGRKYRDMTFSFSGINTYVSDICEKGWNHTKDRMNHTKRTSPMQDDERRHLAREAMRVIFEHLASRILLAIEAGKQEGQDLKTIVLSGGVASNMFLRHVVVKYLAARGFPDVKLIAPPIWLCTDNAAMIAWTACEMYEHGHRSSLDVRALRKWSLENILHPEREKDAQDVIEVEKEKIRLRDLAKLTPTASTG